MTENKDTGAQTVLFIGSQEFGHGDESLGRLLMGKFLDTYGQFTESLSHVVLVNAAANLAIKGSPVLEQMEHLQQMDVKVLTCGTCLDHFGVREDLAVGSVSNMVEIIETLDAATKVIRI